jgi:hypothetical protein
MDVSNSVYVRARLEQREHLGEVATKTRLPQRIIEDVLVALLLRALAPRAVRGRARHGGAAEAEAQMVYRAG